MMRLQISECFSCPSHSQAGNDSNISGTYLSYLTALSQFYFTMTESHSAVMSQRLPQSTYHVDALDRVIKQSSFESGAGRGGRLGKSERSVQGKGQDKKCGGSSSVEDDKEAKSEGTLRSRNLMQGIDPVSAYGPPVERYGGV
jgi:hypothetical protein